METMIAYCGLICSDCPAFLATVEDDDGKRKEVAELWSKEFGHPLKAEDINCDGCLSRSPRVFGYCMNCEIRKCGQEKDVDNCAYCDDYVCEKLAGFLTQAPQAKKHLEEIRTARGGS